MLCQTKQHHPKCNLSLSKTSKLTGNHSTWSHRPAPKPKWTKESQFRQHVANPSTTGRLAIWKLATRSRYTPKRNSRPCDPSFTNTPKRQSADSKHNDIQRHGEFGEPPEHNTEITAAPNTGAAFFMLRQQTLPWCKPKVTNVSPCGSLAYVAHLGPDPELPSAARNTHEVGETPIWMQRGIPPSSSSFIFKR